MSRPRVTRAAALGLMLAGLATPTAVAQQQDLRSPDARAAAPAAQIPQDLRSPDSRDAAAVRRSVSEPAVTTVNVPPPTSAAGGIDWRDAGIGAAIMLGLMLLALSTFAVVHRRHGRPAHRRTAAAG